MAMSKSVKVSTFLLLEKYFPQLWEVHSEFCSFYDLE